MTENILIFGANSAIARAVARLYAGRGASLFLVARDPVKLKATEDDLRARGHAPIASYCADLADTSQHEAIIAAARRHLGAFDKVLIAHGELGQQSVNQSSYAATLSSLTTNFLSPVSLLTILANQLEETGKGTLAVITSVAGDRGRQSNYVYGTAKGALSVFLSGLRQRLSGRGIRIVDLKIGFVDTPMTAHLRKGPLYVAPEQIAPRVVRAIQGGREIIYAPAFWRLIMLVVRSIPETLFKRLKI